MSILDRDRVCRALGERLGDRFLQYATVPDEREPQQLLLRIDEHLAEVHRAAIRWTSADARRELDAVDRMAGLCKRLLVRAFACDDGDRAAIAGAVRYFLDTHDLERDDRPSGFADDAQVVDYVVAAVAPDLRGA